MSRHGKMSDGSSSSTNTLVLLMIAGGLYYMKSASNGSEDGKKSATKSDEERSSMAPLALALVIVFSLKKEIEETVSRERVYTLLAITSAFYLSTVDADVTSIFGSVFASLIVLPAIQEYEKK